jgi:uncharacterized damage-inducible protein DinB
MNACVTFDELLRRNEEETEHWHAWFNEHPELLDLEVDLAQMKDVRGTLQHIFIVEVLYVERIQGIQRDNVSLDDFPGTTVDELFALGARARRGFRNLLDDHGDDYWAETVTFDTKGFGRFTATRRKMFTQAMTHGPWHWGQLSTALRKAGHKQDWGHDFINTKVIA